MAKLTLVHSSGLSVWPPIKAEDQISPEQVQTWFEATSKRLLVPELAASKQLSEQLTTWKYLGRDPAPYRWNKETLKRARALISPMRADIERMESEPARESWLNIINALDLMDAQEIRTPIEWRYALLRRLLRRRGLHAARRQNTRPLRRRSCNSRCSR